MSSPIDLVLSRLPDAKPSGRDRWRCACPVCGGRNRSTLSVGAGDSGAVLIKCWKSGCSPDAIASAIGLQIEDLFPPRDGSAKPLKRRAMLAARQALDLISFECLLISTAGFNLANGHALTVDDLQRLRLAATRVQSLADEARA